MRRVRVIITGRVQGVGYRAWTEDEALARGLLGFVRNRRDGSVEAQFEGPADAVAAMLAACRQGPRHARVAAIEDVEPLATEAEGFAVLPTA